MKVPASPFAVFSRARAEGHNGDAWSATATSDGRQVFAVADGVGSSDRPDLASITAVRAAVQSITDQPETDLVLAFRAARQALLDESKGSTLETTLTVCVLQRNDAAVGHVGDSRLYHLSGSGLVSRTKDQTEVQRLIDEEVITPLRALTYPRKKVLLSVVSSKRDFEIDLSQFQVQASDRLILLTDGAYSVLTKRALVELSLASKSVDELVERATRQLEAARLADDATILAVQLT